MLWKKIKNYKSIRGNPTGSTNHWEDLKWQIALENSEIGLWDYNVITDTVFYSTESKRMLGYASHELGNTAIEWNRRVHPEDIDNYFKDFNAHLNGDLSVYRNEHRIQCKNGSYKWILDKGKVVGTDANGKPSRIIGTHTDITYRKKKTQQSEEHLQLITSQNKRLHNFTHIVSHNLKTHIGNFENLLEFYEDSNSEDEKTELFEHLKTISKALTTTIIDLDDIISIKSKSESNQLNESVNLFNCADKIIKSLEIDSALHTVSIYNTIKQDDVLIANRSYLESILHNLISNGIKYRAKERSPKITLQSVSTDTDLKLLISDNGIGIDTEKYKNQLFEMYQTFHGTKREDSRGIGLYITKTQIEALGGSILVESILNEGTTFTLTFPKQKNTLI
ncbi:sensor histidine kinase [Psychroserpens sp.]|uniref:sensor histidine kinase n=1 Tax=Psychroserpens sp. TaxID=2020870 RepID=UPI003C73998E